MTPICIGHRGAKGYRPENTLPSFEYALELGCTWLELDVYISEGQVIVIHDKDVNRTTNGRGLIEDLSFDYIRSLDAGGGAQVPTLNEVIDLVGNRAVINIELKGKGTAQAVSELLMTRIAHGARPDNFLISSFDHHELALAAPEFRRGVLLGKLLPDMWERAERLAGWSVNFDKKVISPTLVDEAHERGYKVLVYTANSVTDIKRLMACKVDGIFTDFPDRMLSLGS